MSLWANNGSYYESPELSRELRFALLPTLRFRQFADIKDPDQQGRYKGATFHWNIYSKVSADSGLSTRNLVETNTMPTGNFTITQGTLTIDEYGLGVPYTGKYDDLSEHPVKEIIHKALKIDCKEALDTMVAEEFEKTPLRIIASGASSAGTDTSAVILTTDSVCTLTNNVALGKAHIRTIVTTMKERNIPGYTDDDYYALAWPSTFDPLAEDLESVQQYTETGYGHIMRGEKGRFNACRFVEQTNVGKDDMSTAAAEWTNSKSNWAFFFGADTVAEAIAVPEEVRGKIPLDYGRDKGIAWYYLGGAGICHTAHAQARILMWDSAE